jgi:3-(3-hydroxy-phenyl)propionate hydroxylase
MKNYNTSVVITGAGPAGLTLAHLLSQSGVDTILLEKLEKTIELPRAIGIDSEALRTYQAAGVIDDVADEMCSDIEVTEYINGDGELLFSIDSGDMGQPYGFPFFNTFDQATVDRTVANATARRGNIRAWFNHELNRFEQDDAGITVFGKNADGEDIKIEAQYLVGADGAHSTVRKQLGATMIGKSNEYPWLVIDTIDPGLAKDMPSRFFCDPKRPGMTIKKNNDHRRWEWMLMPGETPEDLLNDEVIDSIIAPYTDTSQVDVFRKVVYNFNALNADKWQDKRVFLVGDAAHLTPPFAGQGLNSGFRDIRNLSWKLAMVCKGQLDAKVLESYQLERRDHAQQLIDFALNLGDTIQPIDPQKAAERDEFFFDLKKNETKSQQFVDNLARSMLSRSIDKGLVVDPGQNPITGQLVVQPKLTVSNGEHILLDELLGNGFSIVGYNCDPTEEIDNDILSEWHQLCTATLAIGSGASPENNSNQWPQDSNGIFKSFINGERLIAEESQACDDITMLLIRPDKFCMAAFNKDNASDVLNKAKALLNA